VAEPFFLGVEDVLFIHRREIDQAGGDPGIRDRSALQAAVLAPQVTHAGEYLLDIFNMAAAYLVSIAVRQPFLDGNKRAASATALTFLYLNGGMFMSAISKGWPTWFSPSLTMNWIERVLAPGSGSVRPPTTSDPRHG
jgi:death-on-curing family protein